MVFNDSNATSLDQDVTVSWDTVDTFLMIFGVLGILGNGVVCAVFLGVQRLRKKITSYFIVSLAVADLIASLSLVSQRALLRLTVPVGIAGVLFCKLIYSEAFFWISVVASTLNLVAVTAERYLAIVYPLRYSAYFSPGKALLAVSLIWSLSFLIEIFAFIIYDHDGHYCTVEFTTASGAMANGIAFFLSTYLFPLVFMTFAYIRILRSLRRDHSNLSLTSHVNKERELDSLRARRGVVKMLCIVVVTFFACWTLSQFIFLISFGFGAPINQEDAIFKVSTLLAFSNSCLNPIIYAFRSKQFRQGILIVFCRKDNQVLPLDGYATSHSS